MPIHSRIEENLVQSFRMGVVNHILTPVLDADLLGEKFREGISAHTFTEFVGAVEDMEGLMSLALDMGRGASNGQAAMEDGLEMSELVKKTGLNPTEWGERYVRMEAVAQASANLRKNLASRLAREASIDLVSIHNATVGEPWPNLDYNKVNKAKEILDSIHNLSQYVTTWDETVRAYGNNLKPR